MEVNCSGKSGRIVAHKNTQLFSTRQLQNKLLKASVLWMNDSWIQIPRNLHAWRFLGMKEPAAVTDVAFHSTHRKGYQSKFSFFTRGAADAITEACFIAMTGDRHDELAALDLSMIAVALTPSSWLVWILTYATFAIFFIIPVLFLNTELYKQHEC